MEVLPEGTRVQHVRYGFGKILESDEERTLVNFAIHGFMRFDTRLLSLAVVQTSHWFTQRGTF